MNDFIGLACCIAGTRNIKAGAVQGEMCCLCNDGTCQHSLELHPGLKPLHVN